MRVSNLLRSGNPVMKTSRFAYEGMVLDDIGAETRMTVGGTVNKTLMLGALMMLTASYSFFNPSMPLIITGAIVGLVAVIAASFKTEWSPVLAPVYALAEGLFLGAITSMYANMFEGVVLHAVFLTASIFFFMLFLYKSGLVKVTPSFRTGVIMATGGIALVYILSLVLGMFGINIPFLHENSLLGIGISLFIVGVASLNLLLDFDMIEQGAASRAPKYMEWFAAMGLLVTIVWLYVELLRLLSKLQRD